MKTTEEKEVTKMADIRVRRTFRGKYQLVIGDVFATHTEAEIRAKAILTVMREEEVRRWQTTATYKEAYAELLASPDLCKMRQQVRDLYMKATLLLDVATLGQRAASLQNSSPPQTRANAEGDDIYVAWEQWHSASIAYEAEVERRMADAGIPALVRLG